MQEQVCLHDTTDDRAFGLIFFLFVQVIIKLLLCYLVTLKGLNSISDFKFFYIS
jgi:hypothetical protein